MGGIARIVRFFGWLLFVVSLVFFISMIAMFFTVEKDKWVAVTVGIFFALTTFLGWKIKKFRKRKSSAKATLANQKALEQEMDNKIEVNSQTSIRLNTYDLIQPHNEKEPAEIPRDISKMNYPVLKDEVVHPRVPIKKRRKGFLIAAVIFGIMGLLSIPTVIWAIIYLAISCLFFLVWIGSSDIGTKAEKNDSDEIEVDSPFSRGNNDDPAEQAYNAAVSKKTYTKPFNNIEGDPRYKPLLELCAEIGNDTENNYLPFDPPIPVKIIYCDSDGKTTNREIDILYIAASDFSDDYYIKAFCHLRNENRTFNIKRIQKTIVDGNHVDIIQYLVDTYRNTDKYKQIVLSIKTGELLNSPDTIGYAAKILTYISRIDGIFTRKEKTLIAHFVKELDNDEHDIEIKNYIAELAELNPSTKEYKSIVKMADISEQLIEKAKEITGKDPLRQGAFEILFRQYEKHKLKTPAS